MSEVLARFVWKDGTVDFAAVDRRAVLWKRFARPARVRAMEGAVSGGGCLIQTATFRRKRYEDGSFEFVEED